MNNTLNIAIDKPGSVVESDRLRGEPIKAEELDKDGDASTLKGVESFRNAL